MAKLKGREAARLALSTYLDAMGTGEQLEPEDWQVSDLITDLLLTLPEDTARDILRRVERDNREDRA